MKKFLKILTGISCALALAAIIGLCLTGCASTGRMDRAEARVSALEARMERAEKQNSVTTQTFEALADRHLRENIERREEAKDQL